MSEKPTYTTAYKAAQEKLKLRVCSLLQWSQMEYAEFQYTTGISYLYWYLPTNEIGRYKLERSRLYWNWYKCMWNAYDIAFCESEHIEQVPLKLLRELYINMHCPRALAIDVKPSAVVLCEITQKNLYAVHTC